MSTFRPPIWEPTWRRPSTSTRVRSEPRLRRLTKDRPPMFSPPAAWSAGVKEVCRAGMSARKSTMLASPDWRTSSRPTWISGAGALVGSRRMREPVTITASTSPAPSSSAWPELLRDSSGLSGWSTTAGSGAVSGGAPCSGDCAWVAWVAGVASPGWAVWAWAGPLTTVRAAKPAMTVVPNRVFLLNALMSMSPESPEVRPGDSTARLCEGASGRT